MAFIIQKKEKKKTIYRCSNIFKLDKKIDFHITCLLSFLYYLQISWFLFNLDLGIVYSDIKGGTVDKYLPSQEIYKITKRLKTPQEIEQYFPSFIAVIDCTEQQQIQSRPAYKIRREVY